MRVGARLGTEAVKNQYFGDINDYRKYGLLRALAGGGLKIGVHWMLTPDDGGSDGRHLGYLDQPSSFRNCDPELHDTLRRLVRPGGRRDVDLVKQEGLIPGALYDSTTIPREQASRAVVMGNALARFEACDVVFFDPDNGIEVASCSQGSAAAPKYVFLDELSMAWSRGWSLLVYQHFPRVKRSPYVAWRREQLRQATGTPAISCLVSSTVCYLLIAQAAHAERLDRGVAGCLRSWEGQFRRM